MGVLSKLFGSWKSAGCPLVNSRGKKGTLA